MRITIALLSATTLLAVTALTAAPLSAQTAKPAATHTTASHSTAAHTAAATTSAGGCVKLPDVSPKVPAVPAGAPCAKALFTVTVDPPAHISYASPLEPDIAKQLNLEPTTFTLAYVDTQIGAGELAQPHKFYTVKYTGYLPDGTVFDSSSKHPETADGFSFPIGAHKVITGWDTGFAGMKVGGKRRLYIPYAMAYGAQGQPPAIPPHADLIFDMELVGQSDTPPAPKAPPSPPAAAAPGSLAPGSVRGGAGTAPQIRVAPPSPAAPSAAAPAAPATAPAATPSATPPSSTAPQPQ